jgi:two-component system chemotaxis response regulator CheB
MAEDQVIRSKIVVIGGSAGSLEVIINIIQNLPRDTGAVFIVIVHRKNDKDSVLEDLLSYKTHLKVTEVEDKDLILSNNIYIAPSNYHLLVETEKTFSLDSSEKVHFSRPSIDVTFESVADTFKDRVIGILLSGANADGAAGIARIKTMGGITIVQNPDTAEVAFMPQQAIHRGVVDHILDADNIPAALANLLGSETQK